MRQPEGLVIAIPYTSFPTTNAAPVCVTAETMPLKTA